MDFEFREGGKFIYFWEFIEVSDWGGEMQLMYYKFKR